MTTYSGATIKNGESELIADGDNVLVNYGALVANYGTPDGSAITTQGYNHLIEIRGTVYGATNALTVGSHSSPDEDYNIEIKIYGTGLLSSALDGIVVETGGLDLDNAGTINGACGIVISSDSSTTNTISNSGTINGFGSGLYMSGVAQIGSATLELTNTGTIRGYAAAFNGTLGDPGISRITNSGLMIGDVLLGGGEDLYDGQLGSIQGTVHGGDDMDILRGGALTDVLFGDNGVDYLFGNGGADMLVGGDGTDMLLGGSGADTMVGGASKDTYYVDDAGDAVTEAANGGDDAVNSSISFVLGANIEKLNLIGEGNIDGTGNVGHNSITGNAGANVIDGGAGADDMAGGGGNDRYVVDNAGDLILETSKGGADQVTASVSYLLAGYLETLVLSGNGNINATGNGLANTLTGNSGANTLNGGAEADVMAGGLGADTYIVDNAGDVVTETAGTDIDTVRASVSFTLGARLEDLTLTGNSVIDATGNASKNTLVGNSAANILTGLGGSDTLTGGGGADDFVFKAVTDTTVALGWRDLITDFNHGQGDDIDLSMLDANTGKTGNQAFTFIGETAFSGKAGELRYVNGTSDTVVYGDLDGDKKADFAIAIGKVVELVDGDFVL